MNRPQGKHMQTFDEAWESLEDGEIPSVLLGNGFSQSWNKEIFNYANLLQVACFGEREGVFKQLFR